jgi:hypothetical protein
MKKWVETSFTVLFWLIALAISLGITLGFYYLIFILAKRVFFG